MIRMKRFAALLAVLLTSCSSVYRKEFYVSAYNTEEKEMPCVVLVDDQVYLDDASEPVLTPARVIVPFRESNDRTGFEKIKVGVKSVELDASRKIIRGLRDDDVPAYFPDSRFVQYNDAIRQLFILKQNPTHVPPGGF